MDVSNEPGTTTTNSIGGGVYNAVQVRDVHGNVSLNPGAAPSAPPGWIGVAVQAADAEPGELGVHAAHASAGDALPPYVAREFDTELGARLDAAAVAARGGLVLVSGAPTAGKTRMLAAALARVMPHRMVVIPPMEADLRELPRWLSQCAEHAPAGWVVWLDDLDRHLPHAHLDAGLLAELGHAGALVAATIRTYRLQELRPTVISATGPETPGFSVLKSSALEVTRSWSPAERAGAAASTDARLREAAAQDRFGVAEYLAAGPHLLQEWTRGLHTRHLRGYALVAAACDLARTALSAPLSRAQIFAVHEYYLSPPPPRAESAEAAWDWAIQERCGVAGLLVPADHHGELWRPFDYLTIDQPIRRVAWQAALEIATEADRFAIGSTALHHGEWSIALQAWEPLADAGRPDVAEMYLFLLAAQGRASEAVRRVQPAAEAGDTRAMLHLGILLMSEDRAEAEQWWCRAAEAGDVLAMVSLAEKRQDEGNHAEAEDWWRQAADCGDDIAMVRLAEVLEESGRRQEAVRWRRAAAEQE